MHYRNPKIDAMKGFAILLVVLGHSIQSNVPIFDDNAVFRIIYSFHMPLFMFLSGYVAKPNGIATIRKNAIRLVIPFISWYILLYFVSNYKTLSMDQYLLNLIKSPDNGLWFLWVLFLCHGGLFLSSKINQNLEIGALITVYIFILFLPIDILGLKLLKIHYFYFLVGFLVSKYRSKLVYMEQYLKYLAIFLFPILVQFYHRVTPLKGLEMFSPPSLNYLFSSKVTIIGFKLTLALCGIVVVYQLVKWLQNSFAANILIWLGAITFDIYVVHQSLLFGIGKSYEIKIVTAVVFATFASLMIGRILKQIPIINFLFYGITFKKKFIPKVEC